MNNVVVVCLDTVRKDFFDRYAPTLQAMADHSYNGCRAASSWSIPSHASMLTGKLPHQHGVHAHNRDFSTLPRENVITTQLSDHTAVSVSANMFTDEEFGFDTWFDYCTNVNPEQIFQRGLDARKSTGVSDHLHRSITHEYPLRSLANGIAVQSLKVLDQLPIPTPLDDGAQTIVRRSLEYIDSIEEPYFLFTNFMEAHTPHRNSLHYGWTTSDVPNTWHTGDFDHWRIMEQGYEAIEENESEIKWFRDLYAAAVSYLDMIVASFIREIMNRSRRDVTIIITSDHGENLGYENEDYHFVHTASLSEGLLHVPFAVINPPARFFAESEPIAWSHLALPTIIKHCATADETLPLVPKRYVPAEIVGSMFGSNGPEGEYWDRAMRCLYDTESEQKYVWDSLSTENMYSIDRNNPSYQKEIRVNHCLYDIIEQTSSFFADDISVYKRKSENMSNTNNEEVSESTQKRLETLGYL